MQNSKAVTYVIKQRGAFQSRDKIAKAIAARGTFDYYQAQRFIREVEDKFVDKIALRQLPAVLAIGIPGILAGLYLAVNLFAGLYLGRFDLRAIYWGGTGIGLFLGSSWGIISVVSKIIRR